MVGTKIKQWWLLAVVMLLTGCGTVVFDAKTYRGYVEKRSDAEFQTRALKNIGASMPDMNALTFRELKVVSKFKRKFLCGEVKRRDADGYSSDFSTFLYYHDVDGTIIFEDGEGVDIDYLDQCSQIEKATQADSAGRVFASPAVRK